GSSVGYGERLLLGDHVEVVDEAALLENETTARPDGVMLVDLVDDDDAQALLLAEGLQRFGQAGHDDRGQPERQLVDEQELRPGHEGPADGQHLLLATGEGPGALDGSCLQLGEHTV